MLRASPATTSALAYSRHEARYARFVKELQQFVRMPSISAQPQYAKDVRRCAEWLADHIRQIGLEQVRVVPTARHPIVFAQWRHASGQPTVLIYGHYDVQPVDPLDAWHTPPFEPMIRDGYLYGRGASDDKGQVFAHVKALEASLHMTGRLPVNVVCVFEGEEEIGSPNLREFLNQHRAALAADVAVISDTRFRAPGRPAITYALRGGLGCELEVRGQHSDVHSGTFGGALHNPLQALCEIIARLHADNGRIAIPHFYDHVREIGPAERARLAHDGPDDAELLRTAQATYGWGEHGYSLFERTTIRPALTINGISGGYAGDGGKAVIPAVANAKLSFRLVPDQQPYAIAKLVQQHIAHITPPTVRVTLRTHLATRPALVDPRHQALRAAAQAYRRGFGSAPVLLRSGGSIPVVNLLGELLGIPTVLMGFALPDDRMHAPNERFHLTQFRNGIATCIWFLQSLGSGHPHVLPQDVPGRGVRL